MARSSAPTSPIRNLFSQVQHELEFTAKQAIVVERLELSSKSLPSFRYKPGMSKCSLLKGLNSNDSKTHDLYVHGAAVPLSLIHI